MTNKAVNGFLISDIKNPEKILFEAKRREAFIKDIEKKANLSMCLTEGLEAMTKRKTMDLC